MLNNTEFTKRLENILEYYSLSASSFADQIDVGRSSISHILSGRNKPSLDFIMKIADSFPEVDLYWLLKGEGSFPKKEDTPPSINTSKTVEQQSSLNFSEADVPIPTQLDKVPPKPYKNPDEAKTIKKVVILYTDGTFEAFSHL
ncbi:transcriptional regulator with XRE-family HTH domain [Mesonia hippocampi]|uniref:Transcriptional regulator with XRE-family HTH domain n=1 Tax=Mesonia hippocampi TaxID=1628250 RepID=A0A840EVN6_9FLAO|nr:helix-turn-helix transcriptional regulator [Mesonia hippocampi]MBB4118144.1 transcriptional regulator with XRE-family HTH domain [Mesonia hippocampi]